jgi:hypothetical protein
MSKKVKQPPRKQLHEIAEEISRPIRAAAQAVVGSTIPPQPKHIEWPVPIDKGEAFVVRIRRRIYEPRFLQFAIESSIEFFDEVAEANANDLRLQELKAFIVDTVAAHAGHQGHLENTVRLISDRVFQALDDRIKRKLLEKQPELAQKVPASERPVQAKVAEPPEPDKIALRNQFLDREVYKKHGWSDEDFANEASISYKTVHVSYRQGRKCRKSTLKKMADALGIELENLPD